MAGSRAVLLVPSVPGRFVLEATEAAYTLLPDVAASGGSRFDGVSGIGCRCGRTVPVPCYLLSGGPAPPLPIKIIKNFVTDKHY